MMNDWINSNDKLPEDGLPINNTRRQIRCIVCSGKKVFAATRIRHKYFTDKYGPWYWNCDSKVEYWMLFPEAPNKN